MANGSIYIDPDGVSSISSQMLRSADELDALRRSIVSQVSDVISMSYPAIGTLPEVGYPLGTAQDSITFFNHRAGVLAQDIRTAGYTLNQVAEEGRIMIEQLLHQAIMFTASGQSGSSASGSSNSDSGNPWWLQWLHFTGDYGGAALGTGATLIDQFKSSLEDVSFFKNLIPLMESFKGQAALFGLGVILDYATGGESGHDYSLRALTTDILGGGVGTVVGLTPWGRAAIIVSGAIHIGGPILAAGQNWFGDIYGGTIGEELKQPTENLKQASEKVDIGKVFDDVGRLILDTKGAGVPELSIPITMANSVAGLFGVTLSQPDALPSDGVRTVQDMWTLGKSTAQVAVDVGAIAADDTLAFYDRDIQNLPLPDFVKSAANVATQVTIGKINDTAHFITTDVPKGIENVAGKAKDDVVGLYHHFFN